MDNWKEQAACKGMTATMFPRFDCDIAKALRVCASCPVTAECLDATMAVESVHRFGVAGGLTAPDRARLAGRRGPRVRNWQVAS